MDSRLLMLIVAVGIVALAASTAEGADESSSSAPISNSAGPSSTPPETLQEVTVTAHRVELEKRVLEFVNHIAAAENEEGLPRWKAPICPFVSGLTKEEGEFVIRRISEVARQAGAPLAGENCHPRNLYILNTAS